MIQISGGPALPAAKRVRVYPTREAWESGRAEGGLGSSDVAAVLGVSPYRSEWDVWSDKVLGRERAVDARQAKVFARGHREEPRVLEDYAAETGAHVLSVRQTVVDAARAPLSVSPDAFVQVDGDWGLAEAKTDRSGARWGGSGAVIERWTPAARELVREDYAAQCYSQLLATGLPFVVLAVRRDLDDLRHFVLLRDEALLARMAERIAAWWERHVVRGEQPANDGSEACAAAKARIYAGGQREKKPRPATADEAALIKRLAEVQAQMKVLVTTERRLKADLADAIGEAYGISAEGPLGCNRALFVDVAGRVTVDTEQLKTKFPEVYAQVTRTSDPSRQIRLYLEEK